MTRTHLTKVPSLGVALLASSAACRSRHAAPPAMAVDDSVRMLLAAYEHDQIPLDSAVRRLADLLEPFGGLSASGSISPKAREALDATGRELARRASRRR